MVFEGDVLLCYVDVFTLCFGDLNHFSHGIASITHWLSPSALAVIAALLLRLLLSPLLFLSNREGAAVDDQPSKVHRNVIGRRRDLPSALHQASARGSRVGGKGNGATAPALSPVHEAAATGQTETLSLLLQLVVSVEERDAAAGVEGDTPLGRAVRAGQLDCARLLLDAGAMIGRENARG